MLQKQRRESWHEHEKRRGRLEGSESEQTLEVVGRGILRYGLAGTLWLVGVLKFAEYEAENIEPMVSTSPLFSWINSRMGLRKTAAFIGVTEIALGTLIAARSLSPRASALGSLGATAMFLTTLSFLRPMPGVFQEDHGFPALSMEGQFLAKDGVLLGASILMAAESLRAARG